MLTIQELFKTTDKNRIIAAATEVHLARKLKEGVWLDEEETKKNFSVICEHILSVTPRPNTGEIDLLSLNDSSGYPALGYWTKKSVVPIKNIKLEDIAGAGCTYHYILSEINAEAMDYAKELINVNVCADVLLSLI